MSEDDTRKADERQKKSRDRFSQYQNSTDTSDTADSAGTPDTSDTSDTESTKDDEETGDTPNTADMSEIADTSDTPDTSDISDTTESRNRWMGEPPLSSRKDMNFYLPKEVHSEIMATYAEMNADYRKEHGQDLEKHKQFLPHLLMAALENDLDDVRERLDIENGDAGD